MHWENSIQGIYCKTSKHQIFSLFWKFFPTCIEEMVFKNSYFDMNNKIFLRPHILTDVQAHGHCEREDLSFVPNGYLAHRKQTFHSNPFSDLS